MSRADRSRTLASVLFSSLRRRRWAFAQLAGWSIVEVLPAFLSGLAVARAVDDGFLVGRTATGLAWLGLMGLSIVAGAWGARQVYARLAGIVEPFRDDLVRRVVTGVLHRSTVGGDAPDTAGVGRLTQQVEIVRDTFGGVILVSCHFVFTATSAVLGLLSLVPVVLVFVLPPVLLGLGLFLAALAAMAARQRAFLLADERLAETASTVVAGLRDVFACGGEEQVGATVGEHVDAQARAAKALARLTTIQTLALAIGGWLPLLCLLAGASWLLRHGATTGAVLGAFTYVAYGLHPALHTLIQGLGGSGLRLAVTLDRIVEMSNEPAVDRVRESAERQEPQLRGHDLKLRGVTFGYGTHAEPVIRALDLTISDGDHVAIVGPSGIGKSTLAGLMTGLLEPQAGAVLIGEIPVRELDAHRRALHRVLIPQEAYVFTGTFRENLTYLRHDTPQAEIDEAVDAVRLRPLVERLGGYDTEVDPTALSAGERQLVALTRAYLSPARLVILDEATCHLDPVAEVWAEQAFARRPGTLVVIAHRVSSAMRARRILVMDGAHVMDGTHEGLLAASPLYRDLVGHWTAADPAVPLQPRIITGLSQ
ncbi:MAG: ATP-binding cassette domain-containing protein [Egibacteraceae bacterium]